MVESSKVGVTLVGMEHTEDYNAGHQVASNSIRNGIVIVDFGSQYSHLIARRIRELNVYCEVFSFNSSWKSVSSSINVQGIILSGGPSSVYEEGAPLAPDWVYNNQLPVLGICYGMQVIAHQLGGTVISANKREYGHATLQKNSDAIPILHGLDLSTPVWMSHGDQIKELPQGFNILASTNNSPIAVMGNNQNIIGLQFHPEVVHTAQGQTVLGNFVYNICHCIPDWTPANFVSTAIDNIRQQVGSNRVICALSGGVDSSVTASIIHKAIGDQLTCIFVNNGLLRLDEEIRVIETFQRTLKMNLQYVDASDRFLAKLKGITDPEEKRHLIGEEFIRVFEDTARKLDESEPVHFLAQGTLYPDVIESQTSENSASAKIKTHHNVGGLPADMKMELVEPLRYLFKDEIRGVAQALNLSNEIVHRQPFPGPGLAIRILGEVTTQKLDILRRCDWIVIDEIKRSNLYKSLWQSFAVLTNTYSVGVTGDYRTYGFVVAIRAVDSDDAMTADWARLPFDVLGKISNRIVNEVPEVNRVVYDITSKPPGTIEWE